MQHMQAFTPSYLYREHTAPALMQHTGPSIMQSVHDDGTSYASMNEWLAMPGKAVPTKRAVIRDLTEWRELPRHEQIAMTTTAEDMAEEEEHPTLPRPDGPEEGYKRVYDHLTNQIAYRWPNPGSPRAREGCIGGTWRHIKEVLGHGGSRFVFVDGLVSVYDQQKFTEKLQAQLPYRPHIKPLYAPLKKGDALTAPRQSFPALPVLPGLPPASSQLRDPDVGRKLGLQENFPTNRKGFYKQ